MKIEQKLCVVLDTNIILASISHNSPYRIIFDRFKAKAFDIFITNDILLEYEEKLKEKFDIEVAEDVLNAFHNRSNVFEIKTWFSFSLIIYDVEDNKFSDCAIASNADYLVSNDKHFNVLKSVGFPKVQIIKIDEFVELLKII